MEATEDVSAYPYNYDKWITSDHPDDWFAEWFNLVSGDNVTITITNFTSFSGRTIFVDFNVGVYWYDPDWDSTGLNYWGTVSKSTDVIELWAVIAPSKEVQIIARYEDWYNPGTFDVMVTRTITETSADWKFRQNITDRLDNIEQNLTTLNDTVTLLRNETQHLSNLTLPLFNTTTHLLDNVTLLWQNVSALLSDIDALQQWRATVTSDLAGIGAELDRLNSSLAALEASHAGLAAQHNALAASYNALNATLTSVAADVDVLKASGVDLGWVEQNLTDIRGQIAAIEATLEGMPLLEGDITELEAAFARAILDISNLTTGLAAVEDSIPDAYDDTALRERLAQLEALNDVLGDRVDDLEREQEDQREVKSPDAALVYAAFVIGMLGLIVGVAALLYKKR